MDETSRNREIITRVMEGLSRGDSRLYSEAMTDDFVWRTVGTTAWSSEFRGREAVRAMIASLRTQFNGLHTIEATRIIADGNLVAVEAKGQVMTKSGERYDNTYCMIYELRDGRMIGVTEHLDTALVDRVLQPPNLAEAG